MAKHRVTRASERQCAHCGNKFVTGGSLAVMCSVACRVASISEAFSDPDACWEWPLSRNVKSGYGQLSTWANGKRVILSAHSASYRTFKGPTNDLFVCHACDNPPCFNPKHLFLGTQRDNIHDAISKGRTNHPRGVNHSKARLTEQQIVAIRSDARTHREIAKDYGVALSTVGHIRTHRSWRHVG